MPFAIKAQPPLSTGASAQAALMPRMLIKMKKGGPITGGAHIKALTASGLSGPLSSKTVRSR